jgi:hypothetical protein
MAAAQRSNLRQNSCARAVCCPGDPFNPGGSPLLIVSGKARRSQERKIYVIFITIVPNMSAQ